MVSKGQNSENYGKIYNAKLVSGKIFSHVEKEFAVIYDYLVGNIIEV